MQVSLFNNDLAKVTFKYNPNTVVFIKGFVNRQWYPEGRYWSIPLTIDNLTKLKAFGFQLDERVENWFAKASSPKESLPKLEIEGLKKDLYPFQNEGVQFVESKNGRALIADEMGLGKTIQALAWIQLNQKEGLPVVVLCPASLKLNWLKEVNTWTNLRAVVWQGREEVKTNTDIHIINYDILTDNKRKLRKDIASLKAKTLILDEVHYIKTKNALRTKAVVELAKLVKNVVALSGTPIINKPVEFFNSLNILNPAIFPSFMKFAFRYCNPKHNGYGWNFNGASNIEELYNLLKDTVMIRRTKKEVLADLPDKYHSLIPFSIDNISDYKEAEGDFISWLNSYNPTKSISAERAEALVKYEALRQLAIKGKLYAVIDWVENFIDTGEKLVVFCVHKFVVDVLLNHFKNIAVKLDGGTSIVDRQKAINDFQENSNIKLFIANVKAGGVGVTLTAASNVAFLELPWTPGELVQAEDRCHRIGQKNAVGVYYLVAANTIEQDMIELLERKKRVLDAVIDGQSVEDSNIFTELLDNLKKRVGNENTIDN